MKQPSPDIKALAEEYSAKIQSVSDEYDSRIKALYEEYKQKHQYLMTTRGEQDDTATNYHTTPVASCQNPQEQVLP